MEPGYISSSSRSRAVSAASTPERRNYNFGNETGAAVAEEEARQKPSPNTGTASSPARMIPYVRTYSPGRLKFEQPPITDKRDVHMRTNFGKNMAYVPPPDTPSSFSYSQTTASPNAGVPPLDDESVPFDQLAHPLSHRNSRTQPPTVSRAATSSAHLPHREPSDNSTKPFDEKDDHTEISTKFSTPFDEPGAIRPVMREEMDYFRMPPARTTAPTTYPYEDDLPYEANRVTEAKKVYRMNRGDDDDSVFDFNQEDLMRFGKPRSMDRDRNQKRSHHDESDTSLDIHYGSVTPPTSLQERSQAAWKLKKKQTKKAQSQSNPRASHGVSFGDTDTVHHFSRDDVTQDNTFDNTLDNTLDDLTLGDRSLNSFYTKSMESEVEDAIKDIFLIGKQSNHAPGRRKVKDNPRVKERLYAYAEEDEDDETRESDSRIQEEGSIPTSQPSRDGAKAERNSHLRGKSHKKSKAATGKDFDEKKEETDDIGDPVAEAWTFVESSLAAVGKALGYEDESVSSKSRSTAVSKDTNKEPGFGDILGYATEMLIGPDSPCSKPHTKLQAAEKKAAKQPPSIEEDVRLVDLAAQAGKSSHKLQGYEIDPSYEIDIVNDIAFSVVDLKLPLGIIFQEHDHGCWVTKILPEGSAYQSRKVHVGDQLAAIEGSSAIDMRVEDVAEAIKKKKKKSVELTFLRYVGKMRPAQGRLREEGYEISAKTKTKTKYAETFHGDQPAQPKIESKPKNETVKSNRKDAAPVNTPKKPDPVESSSSRPAHTASKTKPQTQQQKQVRSEQTAVEKQEKKKFGLFRLRR